MGLVVSLTRCLHFRDTLLDSPISNLLPENSGYRTNACLIPILEKDTGTLPLAAR